MQTGSSGTLIGWKSGQTPYVVSLCDRMRERGYGLWYLQHAHFFTVCERCSKLFIKVDFYINMIHWLSHHILTYFEANMPKESSTVQQYIRKKYFEGVFF
jgi:hypothetical protein